MEEYVSPWKEHLVRSVRTKLFAGFGAVLALLAATVIFAILGLSAVNESAKTLGESDVPAVEALGTISESAQAYRQAQFFHGASSDPKVIEDAEEQTKDEGAHFGHAMKTYEPTIVNAEDRRGFEETQRLWDEYTDASAGFLAPSRAGENQKAADILLDKRTEFDALTKYLEEYLELNEKLVAADVKAAADAYESASRNLLIVAAIALLAGFGIAYVLARQIRAGAQQMLSAAQGIPKGASSIRTSKRRSRTRWATPPVRAAR